MEETKTRHEPNVSVENTNQQLEQPCETNEDNQKLLQDFPSSGDTCRKDEEPANEPNPLVPYGGGENEFIKQLEKDNQQARLQLGGQASDYDLEDLWEEDEDEHPEDQQEQQSNSEEETSVSSETTGSPDNSETKVDSPIVPYIEEEEALSGQDRSSENDQLSDAEGEDLSGQDRSSENDQLSDAEGEDLSGQDRSSENDQLSDAEGETKSDLSDEHFSPSGSVPEITSASIDVHDDDCNNNKDETCPPPKHSSTEVVIESNMPVHPNQQHDQPKNSPNTTKASSTLRGDDKDEDSLYWLEFRAAAAAAAADAAPPTNAGGCMCVTVTSALRPLGTVFKFVPLSATETEFDSTMQERIFSRFQCISCMKVYENMSLEELRLADYLDQRFKFVPLSATDIVINGTQQKNIITRHQCISCMKVFQDKSLEELRLGDYLANRRGTRTTIKFVPPSAKDTMMKGGTQVPIDTRYQCITRMEIYEDKSLEELRLADYQASGFAVGESQTTSTTDIASSVFQQPGTGEMLSAVVPNSATSTATLTTGPCKPKMPVFKVFLMNVI